MKKSVTRIFSVLMALVMLFGMSASAQVSRITFNLNGSDGLKLDAILSGGFDEDGCEQYMLENSVIGKWVLQSDGYSLVFGSEDQGYYAVTAEDLANALVNVITAIANNELGQEFFNVINYINSPDFESDAYMIGQILGNEANRFAAFAQSMGLVVIHENGDLEINCTLEQFFELLSSYLSALAEDQAVLSAFTDLSIFNVFDIPVKENADQLPEMLKNAADQVAAAAAEAASTMDGSVNMYINAQTGETKCTYYAAVFQNGETLYSVTETFVISQTSYEYESVTIANGGEIKEIVRSNGNGMYVYYGASAAGQTAEFEVDINSFGLNAKMVANTNELSGEGNLVINETGIKGECDFAGEDLSLVGEISYDPISEEFLLKVNSVDGADSAKINCEYADDELYAEIIAIDNGRIIANITVSGSDTLRVNGSWTEKNANYLLNATLRDKKEGNELEGTLQVSTAAGQTAHYTFGYAENLGKNTEEIYMTASSGAIKMTYEAAICRTGSIESVSLNMLMSDGVNTEKVEAVVEIDSVGNSVCASWTLDVNGQKLPGSFYIGKDLIEFRFSQNGVNYRIYAENMSSDPDVNIIAGVSAVQDSDPDTLLDMILFTLNANCANGLNFEAILNTLLGVYAAAGFDGETLKLDITADNTTVTAEGKQIVTENAQYTEFTGMINGMPFTVRSGMKLEDASTVCIFSETDLNGEKTLDEMRLIQKENGYVAEIKGDSLVVDGEKIVIELGMIAESEESLLLYGEIIGEVPGHKLGAYLPITAVEKAGGASVSASLSVAQGDQTMEIGNVFLGYEELSETLPHVSGMPLSANDLTNLLLQLLYGSAD